MKKYLSVLLLFVFIIVNETIPFLYNDAYTIRDIKWGWVIGFPLILWIANNFMKHKAEEKTIDKKRCFSFTNHLISNNNCGLKQEDLVSNNLYIRLVILRRLLISKSLTLSVLSFNDY